MCRRRGSKDSRGRGFKGLFSKDFVTALNFLSISARSFITVASSPLESNLNLFIVVPAFSICKESNRYTAIHMSSLVDLLPYSNAQLKEIAPADLSPIQLVRFLLPLGIWSFLYRSLSRIRKTMAFIQLFVIVWYFTRTLESLNP